MAHLKYPPMRLSERAIDLNERGWSYEIKFDGYRLMADVDLSGVTLRTRNGANATKWFPETAADLKWLSDSGPCVFDGEICAMDDLGRSTFEVLQKHARRRR